MEKKKYHILIVTINPIIRVEFQEYLNTYLGEYISFDTSDLSISDPSQIRGYDGILFSSKNVCDRFPDILPDHVARFICSRTFNPAYLDQIIQIPPGERVYVVNDTIESTLEIIDGFRHFGLTQYQFIPYAPPFSQPDRSVHYAITIGEPQLVPSHIRNFINIGNRVINISTINELCFHFHLPAQLSNRITDNYISSILKIVKTLSDYYSSYVSLRQLLSAVISNIAQSLCLLDSGGKILMLNHGFRMDWGITAAEGIGGLFSTYLPEDCADVFLGETADYAVWNKMGQPMILDVMELPVAGSESFYLLTGGRDESRKEREEKEGKEGGTSPIERQRVNFMNIVTVSERCRRVLDYARRLSLYDFPVLIQGEEGTQKKMLAQAIHRSSKRRGNGFINLNQMRTFSDCTPGDILQAANGGTLLVDEIENLSWELQDFLLQVLQSIHDENGEYGYTCNIRVIATSSVDLYALAQEGRFRKNLYFQLCTAIIDTVPLRQRREDIPILLDQFFRNMFHDPRFEAKTVLSPSLYQFMMSYDYPGNVQELMNLARYFYSQYSAHPLILSHLPSYIRRNMPEPESSRSSLSKEILAVIRQQPKIGRASIQKLLEESGIQVSEGKLRSALKKLAEDGLLQIHRTKGGCEITDAGQAFLDTYGMPQVKSGINSARL